MVLLGAVWIAFPALAFPAFCFFRWFCWLFSVNSAQVHCSQNSQTSLFSNFFIKMGLTVLFTYLKIILLQYFQFSVFSCIQTDSKCGFGYKSTSTFGTVARFQLFFFFFFFLYLFFFQPQLLTKSFVNSARMHYSRIHKLHFSVTFSLKMGPTVLFTYLKIILLQSFQFSVSAK